MERDWRSITRLHCVGCNVWKHRLNHHMIWSDSKISSMGSWCRAGAERKTWHWAECVSAGGAGKIGMSGKFLSLMSRAAIAAQSEDAPTALLTVAWHWTQQDQVTWASPDLITKVWLWKGLFKAFESLCRLRLSPITCHWVQCTPFGKVCVPVSSR